MRVALLAVLLLAAPLLVAEPAAATSCVDDLGGLGCAVVLAALCVVGPQDEKYPHKHVANCVL